MEDPNENSMKTIAIVCVLSDVLNSTANYASLNVGDYLQAFLSSTILSQNRKFSEVRMLTSDPIKEVINQFFTDKVYFQYKDVKFEYPKDLLLQNPIISNAEASNGVEKFPDFFDQTISKYKDEDNTSLFLFMVDHGNSTRIGKLKFSHLLSTLSKKNFKFNYLFIDSCQSGSLIDYVNMCKKLNADSIDSNEARAIASIINETKLINNIDCTYDVIQTLHYINIKAFLKNASLNQYVFKVISNFSQLEIRSTNDIIEKIAFDDVATKAQDFSDLKEACKEVDNSKKYIQKGWIEKLYQIGVYRVSDFKSCLNFLKELGLDSKLRFTLGIYYLHQIYLEKIDPNKTNKDISEHFIKLQKIVRKFNPFGSFTLDEAINICKILAPSSNAIVKFVIPPTLNLSVISSSSGLSSAYFYHRTLINGTKIALGSYGTEFAALLACKSFMNFEEIANDISEEIYNTTVKTLKEIQRPAYTSSGPINQNVIDINKIIPKTPVFDMVCQKNDKLLNNFIRSSIYLGIIPTDKTYMLPIAKVSDKSQNESSSDEDTKSPTISTITSRSNSTSLIVENQMDHRKPQITSSVILSDAQEENEPNMVITQSQGLPRTDVITDEDLFENSQSSSFSSGSDLEEFKNPESRQNIETTQNTRFTMDSNAGIYYVDETPWRYKILGKSTIKMFFDCLNFQLIEHGYKEYYPDAHELVIDEDEPAFDKFEVYEDKIDFGFKHYIYYSTIRNSLVLYLWANRKPENPDEIYDLFMDVWNHFSPINDFYIEHNDDCLNFR